jgi:SOS-response transcriptional repressor LexA
MRQQRVKRSKTHTATPGQFKLLRWVAKYHHAHGYMPTIREICAGMRFSSTQSPRNHLLQLERLGWVRRIEGKDGQRMARTLQITPLGMEALRVA